MNKSVRFFGILSISLTVSVIGALLIATPKTQAHGDDAQGQVLGTTDIAAATPSADVVAANNTLNTDLTSYTKATTSNRTKALAKLVASAKVRKARMLKEATDNPAGFLKATLPAATFNKLPKEVQDQTEQGVEVAGKLQITHVDNFKDPSKTHYEYQLRDSKNNLTYKLNFANNQPTENQSGSQVKVSAVKYDTQLVLAAGNGTSTAGTQLTVMQSAPPVSTIGDQHTLVMLVSFSNSPTVKPYTKSQVYDKFFGSTNSLKSFYLDSSYGQTSFSGDVTDWLNIPLTNACPDSWGAIWYDPTFAAAKAAGYNLDNYTHLVLIAEGGACGSFSGISTVGSPSTSMVQGLNFNDMYVVYHELGHALGMNHAGSLNCSDPANPTGCGVTAYGDHYDIMGVGDSSSGLNVIHRSRLNWLPAQNIQAFTTTGLYTITQLEQNTSAIQGLKIPKSAGDNYYVEYRKANSTGAMLVVDNGYGTTADTARLNNATLTDGLEFKDPSAGLSIKQISHTTSTVTVQVSSCIKSNPRFNVPNGYLLGAPGSTLTFNISLLNKDTSGCAPSTFAMSTTGLPTGFTAVVNPPSASIVAGASGVFTIAVTSPANATAAHNYIYYQATDINDSSHSNNNQLDYGINNTGGCSRNAPTLSVSPNSYTSAAGGAKNYAVQIINNDSVVSCGKSTFNVSVINLPPGFTSNPTSLTPNLLDVDPGKSGVNNIIVTSPTSAVDASWNLTFVIVDNNLQTDSRLQAHSLSMGANYTVNNSLGCAQSVPTVTPNPTSLTGKAGDTLTYTVTVKNNDSTGCAGTSNFVLSTANLPSGFSGTFNPTTLNLAPQATGTTTLSVVSPTSVTNGINNFTISATDSSIGSTHSSSPASTAYVVNNPVACARGVPTLSLNTYTNTGVAGSAQTYIATIKNNDTTGCTGTSTFTFGTPNLPSGFTGTFNPTTLTLASQATGTTTLSVVSPSSAVNGTSNFTISATDSTIGSTHTATPVSASYTVLGNSCIKTNPGFNITNPFLAGVSGSTLVFNVNVLNKDSGGCGSSTFALSTTSVPTGFTAVVNPPSLSIAAGASGAFTITVTSPANAAAANYVINFKTADTNDSNHSNTNTITYGVNNNGGCVRNGPTLSVSPQSNTSAPGGAKNYTVQIINNDSVASCSKSTFNITAINLPLGFTSTPTSLTPNLLDLNPGTSGVNNIIVTSPTSAAEGLYNFTFMIADTDATAHNHELTIGGVYIVQNSVICTRSAPTITLYQSSQTGKVGDALGFYVTIKNNDSSACTSSTFTPTYNLPTGLIPASLSPATLTIAPGLTNITTLIVISSTLAANGTNNFTISATDSAVGSAHTSTPTPASYIVNNPNGCTRQAPTITPTPVTNTAIAGVEVSYFIDVRNNDSSTCANSQFSLSTTNVPSGFTADFTPSLPSLAPGATGTVKLLVDSPASAPSATNNFNVVTTDNAVGSSHSASKTLSYVVNNSIACVRNAPTISLVQSSKTGLAGSFQTYTVNLKNNDSANCGNSFFNIMGTSLPSGFTSSNFFRNLAPGESCTVDIDIYSPTTAANSTYTFNMTANDTNHSISTPGTFIVNNPTVCTRGVPTVTISPANLTGKAGDTLTYTVTVKNNDSTGCTGTSTFILSNSGLPSGFFGTFSPTTLTLAASSTGTSTLSVVSPSSATNSTNNFTVSASDSSMGSTHTSTPSSASYVVNNPVVCTRSTPTITPGSTSNTGAAGSTQTYTLTVKNNDSTTGCSGTSTFALSNSALISGFNGSFSPTSLTLAPQGTGSATFSLAYPASAVNGSNTFTITANDSSVSGHGATTNSLSYIVNNPIVTCTRATPTISLSPSTQTGNAGSTQTYTATLKNNDSTTNCSGTSTFSLSSLGLPSGWTGTFSPSSLTLAPQATGTSTLSVVSASNISSGNTVIFYASAIDSSVGTTHTSNQAQGSYTVQVVNTCTRTKPTLSINPNSVTIPLFQPTAYFNLSVTNNDSPNCNFSSRLFFLAASNLPSNYYLNGGGNISVYVAPGATSNSQIAIIVSSGTTDSTTPFTIYATDTYGYNSTTATLVVGNGGGTPTCTRGTANVSMNPTSNTAQAGQSQSYTLSIKNNDSSTCSSSVFSIAVNGLPSGFSGTPSSLSLSIAPQGTGTTTITVTSPSSATNQTANFTTSVSDSTVGSTHSGSSNGSYIVSNPVVTCTHGIPTLSLSPSSSTGQAGQTLSYTLTLKNNDSSSNCSGTSTFTLSNSGLPSGFTGTFSPSTITLAAQATGTATLNISSPSSAVNSTNNFSVSATDSSIGSTHTSNTASSSYVVSNPVVSCTRGIPTISINPSSNTGAAGSTQTYTVSVTNTDSTTNCTSPSVFTLSSSNLPSGFTGSFSPSTLSLAPGSTNTSTLSVTSPSSATNSTNNFTVSATDSTVGSTHTSLPTSASYVVNNPTGCQRSIPSISASPSTTTITAGQTINFTLTVTNTDTPNCGLSARTYTIMPFYLGNNFYVNGTTPSLTLNAGSSGSVIFPIYSLNYAASGSVTGYFDAFPTDTFTTYSKTPIIITIGSVKGDSTTTPSNQTDNTTGNNTANPNLPHPQGTLIKIDNTLYIVGQGGLIGIPSMAVLQSWGLDAAGAVQGNLADQQLFQIKVLQMKQLGQTNILE